MKKHLPVFCIVAAALLLVIAVAMVLQRSSDKNVMLEAPQTGTSGQIQSTTQDTTPATGEGISGFATKEEEETVSVTGAVTQVQEETIPTQPSANTEKVELPETTQAETDPAVEATTQATTPEQKELTYEAYLAMSTQEQLAYMNSYADIEAFAAWFDAAKKEYDANNQGIEVTGPINMEDFIKP